MHAYATKWRRSVRDHVCQSISDSLKNLMLCLSILDRISSTDIPTFSLLSLDRISRRGRVRDSRKSLRDWPESRVEFDYLECGTKKDDSGG